MNRYGYAIKIGGDPEISGALKSGMVQALVVRRPLRISPTVRRLDMRRHTPAEWRAMTLDARQRYAMRPAPAWAQRLLVGYALAACTLRTIFTGRAWR